ncbi:unnamed protein product [Cercospora beticola]|nr:unnamed protein product [Cercospora beticola]
MKRSSQTGEAPGLKLVLFKVDVYIRLCVALLVERVTASSGVGPRYKGGDRSTSFSVDVSLEIELSNHDYDLAAPYADAARLTTTIVEAQGNDVFQPIHVIASWGDLVKFQFLSSSTRTVKQSTFEYPCIPSGSLDMDYLTAENENIDVLLSITSLSRASALSKDLAGTATGVCGLLSNFRGHKLDSVKMLVNGTTPRTPSRPHVSSFPTIIADGHGICPTQTGTATGGATVLTDCVKVSSMAQTGFAHSTTYGSGALTVSGLLATY